ncbi:hypothetical protein ACIQHU_01210 [Streptomyces tendae]|uniref:hypothetical protein n=1 Tax=Streptomyces tendae TaxID=1932 RepID=UPI0038210D79
MTGPACGNNPNHQLTDGDRQAVDSFRAYLTARAALNRVRTVLETEAVVGRTALEYRGLILTALMSEAPPADQTALRDRIAAALRTTRRTGYEGQADHGTHRYDARCALCAGDVDALTEALIAAVLPATTGCLTPDYTDGPCHCPSCDPAAHRADRAAVLREAYEIAFAEGMRLNALEAEIGVGPYRGALAVAHLLRKAISEAQEPRRMADETAAAETQPADALSELEAAARALELDRDAASTGESRDYRRGMTRAVRVLRFLDSPDALTEQPFVPPAHYRRDDGVDCCVHAIPVGPDSCRACRELADDTSAAGARQDGAQR